MKIDFTVFNRKNVLTVFELIFFLKKKAFFAVVNPIVLGSVIVIKHNHYFRSSSVGFQSGKVN